MLRVQAFSECLPNLSLHRVRQSGLATELDEDQQIHVQEVLYSLDITPPSIISPSHYLHKFAAEVYLSPIYAPFGHTWKI